MTAVNVDDVLKIVHEYGKYIFVTDEKKYSDMVDEISNLKALEQEPKIGQGHWIEVIDNIDGFGNKTWHHECSICGNGNSGWGEYKYCPNCGAKMDKEDNNLPLCEDVIHGDFMGVMDKE